MCTQTRHGITIQVQLVEISDVFTTLIPQFRVVDRDQLPVMLLSRSQLDHQDSLSHFECLERPPLAPRGGIVLNKTDSGTKWSMRDTETAGDVRTRRVIFLDHSGIGTCVCVAKQFLAVRVETSIGEPFVREDDVCLVDPFEDPLPVHAESGWASCTVRGQAVGGPVARVIS